MATFFIHQCSILWHTRAFKITIEDITLAANVFFFFRESSAGIAKHHFVYHFSYFSSDESTNNSFGRAIFFFSWDRDFT